ncbi:M67 family metallopeptidase [Pectinatus frisingensis]|uniref:M67 family metallopeptidase n=1 Tax=Pectinatus frisingensis TaxID=865 RepID=UPI0018C60A35|nr:M67 family metallopeptidase [Pectinatus frisingensis]
MIVLQKKQMEDIVKFAKDNLPNEACGLISGIKNGQKSIVEKIYFLTNMDHSSEHFSMNIKEQFDAVKDMRQFGYTLLGNFHSHPSSLARPSDEDKRLAFDAALSYLILSLADERPILKSFKIENKISSEELVTIL